jgi:DNA-binding protein HU-beta
MQSIEVAKEIAEKLGLQVKDVTVILEAERKVIMRSVAAGEPVYYRRFGTFEPIRRKAKTARNIKTNTQILVPSRVVPFFRACNKFTQTVINKAS